jgi:hypothetical protein
MRTKPERPLDFLDFAGLRAIPCDMACPLIVCAFPRDLNFAVVNIKPQVGHPLHPSAKQESLPLTREAGSLMGTGLVFHQKGRAKRRADLIGLPS